jgi:type II secretory pathway component PulC
MAISKVNIDDILTGFVLDNDTLLETSANEDPEMYDAVMQALTVIGNRFGTGNARFTPSAKPVVVDEPPIDTDDRFAVGTIIMGSDKSDEYAIIYEIDSDGDYGIQKIGEPSKKTSIRKVNFEDRVAKGKIIRLFGKGDFYYKSDDVAKSNKYFIQTVNEDSVWYKRENKVENIFITTIDFIKKVIDVEIIVDGSDYVPPTQVDNTSNDSTEAEIKEAIKLLKPAAEFDDEVKEEIARLKIQLKQIKKKNS